VTNVFHTVNEVEVEVEVTLRLTSQSVSRSVSRSVMSWYRENEAEALSALKHHAMKTGVTGRNTLTHNLCTRWRRNTSFTNWRLYPWRNNSVTNMGQGESQIWFGCYDEENALCLY
jgi:hypothetical protein